MFKFLPNCSKSYEGRLVATEWFGINQYISLTFSMYHYILIRREADSMCEREVMLIKQTPKSRKVITIATAPPRLVGPKTPWSSFFRAAFIII